MRVSKFTLVFLTTFLGHQTTTALTQLFDAYGVTSKGLSCTGHRYMNFQVYAQAKFACKEGKPNHAITNDANVKKHFENFLPIVLEKVRDAGSTGTLYLAPLLRGNVVETQNTFIGKNSDLGSDRLVLNENCDIITAITNSHRRNEGESSSLDIQICKKYY
ncbi:hypothetical protein GcM1_173006 [Golovinomyces cichoracearum]|uniref:Secreted effector protein n=1 Tax=Golovinomyces cichoracearum TaxID=62708 RepID=A0A420J5Z7_9PEZI|nr:hypothetical protein GcM1_173006 [Golovinomyces cichoracearum]